MTFRKKCKVIKSATNIKPKKIEDIKPPEKVTDAKTEKTGISSRIRDMIQSGKNPQEIADALGVKLSSTEAVIDLKTTPDSILKSQLVTALNLLQLAELNYKEYMTHNNLSAVNETISTVQSLVKDLQAYQDPLKFYAQLDEIIIQAATKAYLQILTTELHAMRGTIFELIPIQKQSAAQKIFAGFFDGIAGSLKMQYTDIRRILARTLGVESQVEYLNADGDAPTGRQKITRGDASEGSEYQIGSNDDRD